ncbi:MAG: hypothetical protein ORO03_11305 [Alphaproteobacteria bacterium]|nr:hypothetical protein [Alphaproteobacteria bacterium]
MKIPYYLIFLALIPTGIMVYNLIVGGWLFFNMTPLAYFLYFGVPAVGVLAYIVSKMETVEDREKKRRQQ